MAEFLDKGFQGASLRQIVKNAGVTTGAFYGYFPARRPCSPLSWSPMPPPSWGSSWRPRPPSPSCLRSSSRSTWAWSLLAVSTGWWITSVAHREPVKLLLCCAEGTSYEHFVHNMVEAEVEYTQRYMEVLRRLGRDIPVLDKSLCHIIASGMFNGIFEIVVHDMPRDQAMRMWISSGTSTPPDG